MSKRITPYQRLKMENERLRKEIRVLVTQPESIAAAEIKMSRQLSYAVQDSVWYGSPLKVRPNEPYGGILKRFQPSTTS